jgi:mannose-6-phosphate isomerase-like protein (cupin superfamily)
MADHRTPYVLGAHDGERVEFAGLGVRFMVDGMRSGGGFSLVEHPLAPRALGSPIHTHRLEDEYSYVVEGEIGILLGDEEVEAHPGDLVYKPRHVPHAFWNATERPARVLEIVSPAGFERFFVELADANAAGPPDPEAIAALAARYGHELDFDSIPGLCERYGLTFGGYRIDR